MDRIFRLAGTGCRTRALAMAIAFGITAVASDARAAEGGWYMGLQVPLMFIDDTESTTTGSQTVGQPPGIPYSANATSEYDTGFKIAGVVGYELGGGLRVEGELFLARAKVDKLTYGGVNAYGSPIPGLKVDVPVSGAAKQLGGFASIWYDFRTGSDWTPYVGAGVGLVRVDQGDLEYDPDTLVRGTLRAIRSNPQSQLAQMPQPQFEGLLNNISVPEISAADTRFAYHVGVGIGYRLDDKLTLQFGYRLQNASGLEFSGRNATGIINVNSDLRAHLLEIGFRSRF